MNALIGHTGFVGSNILEQCSEIDFCYNSKNIGEIKGMKFDTLICSGVRATKWLANKNPKEDLLQIIDLITNIRKCSFNKIILISTIGIYTDDSYGKNREYLEDYIKNNHKDFLIVRLPGLFGKGLKKNPVYNLMNGILDYLPSNESTLQYYCLDNIWKDINIAIDNNLSTINIGTEPILFKDILDLFGYKISNEILSSKVSEDMQTEKAKHWNKKGNYLYSKEEVLFELKNYIENGEYNGK